MTDTTSKNMKNLLRFAILLIVCVFSRTVYSESLCASCECRQVEYSLSIDCRDVVLDNAAIEWPEEFVNDTICEDKTLTINLVSNNITKLSQFPPLKCKQIHLFVRKNPLKDIAFAAFRDLKNLIYLNLEQNQLTSDIVYGDIFRGAYNDLLYEPLDLETLHLDYNRLHSLGTKTFSHTPHLKQLYLANNPLEMIDSITMAALSSLHVLETLDLSYTGISTIPDEVMKNMKHLQDLRLSGNKFTTVPESLGFTAATLRKLVFSQNLLTEINSNSFLGLWRLEILEVGGMPSLTSVKSNAFSQLVSLQMLHLCNNINLKQIDHDAFEYLKNKWTIKELHIQDNGLTSLSAELLPWKQLIYANLENNPWECDCLLAYAVQYKGIAGVIDDTSTPRCLTPIELAGLPLRSLTTSLTCPGSDHRNMTAEQISSPYFMRSLINRPRNAIVGFLFVCLVVVCGMAIGYGVNYFKGKIRKNKCTTQIRYVNLNNSL